MQKAERLFNKYFFAISFVLYAILLHLFYWKTRGAGFVFDMTEWLYDYERHPNFNIFNPPFDKNLRPVYHFLLYTIYKTFGTDFKAWYLFNIGLFYGTILTIHSFLSKLYKRFHIEKYKELTILTCIAIVVCPFGSEIAVWYATIHYSIVFICLFLTCILILSQGHSLFQRAVLSALLFSMAILSIELSYSIIPISGSLFLLLYWKQKTDLRFNQYIIFFFIPHLLIFLAYNFICYKYYDKFLGHYRIDKVDFDVLYLIVHYFKLLVKHFTFINLFGQGVYHSFFQWIDENRFLFITCFIAPISYLIFKTRRRLLSPSPEIGIILFLIACSVFLYIPVSFLFFHNWKEIELDRLGYGSMAFIIMALFFVFWQFKSGVTKSIVFGLFLLASSLLLYNYNSRWEKSATVRKHFSENLPFYKDKNIYLVGAPILMQYAYLITINDSLELYRHLRVFRKQQPTKEYKILGFYNMLDIDDMISVTKLNDTCIEVRVERWGTWCWNNLKSAIEPKETNKYIVEPNDDKLGYKITFKSLDSNDKIILFNKLNFKEVDLRNKPNGTLYI
jgi:hypothetical protein